MTAHFRTKGLLRSSGAFSRYCALTASLLLLGACASTGSMPGIPWQIWATVRSLVGAPPAPPDSFPEPVIVSDTLKFAAITAGGAHTCALTVDGDTYCWGSNLYQQLGTAAVTETCGHGPGTFSCSSTPVRLEDAPRFTEIAASQWSTCGLDASGSAHCWGFGLGGQTENSLPVSSGVPVEVPGDHTLVALAASASSNGRTCALTADGPVWCWGLSDGTAGSGPFAGPDPVATSHGLISIGVGGQHACGIDEARQAYCWGANELGALGVGASRYEGGIRESSTPLPVQGGLELNQVVAASGYSCGLDVDGAAHCWGSGFPVNTASPAHPRLSDNPLPHGALPIPIDMRGTKWAELAAGGMQTCGLTADGEVYCFRATPAPGVDRRPILIETDQAFVTFAVGSEHACGIGADGFAYCWGRSHAAQVGQPPSGRRW